MPTTPAPRRFLDERPKLSPEPPTKPVEEPGIVLAAAAGSATANLPHIVRRKRTSSRSLTLPAGLFTGTFTALFALMLGTFWWLEASNYAMPAKRSSPSLTFPSSSSTDVATSGQRSHPINTVANHYSGKNRKETSLAKPQAGSPADMHASIAVSRTNSTDRLAAESKADSNRHTSGRSDPASEKKSSKSPSKIGNPQLTSINNGRADEISRLKAQAFSETKKDRVGAGESSGRRSSSKTGSSKKPAKKRGDNTRRLASKQSLAYEFKQCKRKSNFFQREKCKWRVCAGKWGKNGCPSYNHEIARY